MQSQSFPEQRVSVLSRQKTFQICPVLTDDRTAAGRRPAALLCFVETGQMCSVKTGQMCSVDTGQISAAETGQMSAAKMGQMSAVETRQMLKSQIGGLALNQ